MTTYTLDELVGAERMDSRDLIESREEARNVLTVESSDESEREEARILVDAIDALEREGIPDWEYGAQFIREDYFQEYAMELADDIGAIPNGVQWPLTCIDWGQAARDLADDYTLVSFLGHHYLVR